MKFMVVILLFWAQQSLGAVQKKEKQISVKLKYAILDAEVACVVRYHPRSEGEEEAELFYMNVKEYKQYLSLVDQGYSAIGLKGGLTCNLWDGNMSIVHVSQFDKSSTIRKVAKDEAASVKGKVILVNKKSVDKETKKYIESLLSK